ncbi:MAG: TetR/AcrR family transcriptional regulator [Chloroflexi bacterium]|nr:TetR/AcrR family transcriptional regulator [Chloroflexota bacterium]
MATKNDPQQKTGTRQRILAVASRLFAEKGYTATSVRDIAAELGIANPSLYYHFKSKSDILVELLAEPLQRVAVAAEEAKPLSGEARTRRIIHGLLEALEVHSGIAVTAFQEAEQISDTQNELVFSNQAQVVELLGEDVAEDHRHLRVTMAIAGVQGVVQEIMRESSDADAFVKQLRDRRDIITDLVIKLLH